MRKKIFKRGMAAVLALMVMSMGLTVNAEESYTVKEGDYLQKIARSAYGDSARWEDIYEANKASVKNPNILYKGQVLILPDVGLISSEEEEETASDADITLEQEETVSDAVMTLEQWTLSEECSEGMSYLNEVFVEWGLLLEFKADGNTLLFVYHYMPEVWGELSSEEMAVVSELFDMESYFNEMLGDLLPEMQQEFATEYGIALDGVGFIYVAPDGVPFSSVLMPIGNV